MRLNSREACHAVAPTPTSGDPLDDLPLNDRGHFASLPADWGNPEQELSQRQFIEILELCTDKLPAAQGRAFMMREWLELPAEDICKELAVSTTNLMCCCTAPGCGCAHAWS